MGSHYCCWPKGMEGTRALAIRLWAKQWQSAQRGKREKSPLGLVGGPTGEKGKRACAGLFGSW